ncbi:hypothetical protein SETIT_9G015000v2 [Setaria italica]|uniref:RRM domain-containing protein n=1 Tax=Setaria italica TaxID=4555 RepID=A0A368SDT4_SETIT|nr:hypothetical protein SETIT_9G015000v2 [Setaria italica]
MHGRQLYYRLVFLLGMDPSLSIEIIAFWLLVEGNSEVDFLRRINSFHGDHFLALVATGKQFIDALHGNLVDLKSRSAREFHSQVMLGICFFLNNVCYKVLTDLRQKAEHGSYLQYQGDCSISRTSTPSAIKSFEDMVRTRDEVLLMNAFSPDSCNMIPQQQNNATMSISSRSIMPTAIQNHQDMVKMRYGTNSMNTFSTDLDIISPQQQNNIGMNISSGLDIHDLESLFNNCTISPQFLSEWDNTFPQSSTMNMDPYVHSPVPQDDRTLFVTFSNGYPLTKKEVYNFFMSNFGDVESLRIEEPVELRPPQYAVVIFGSLETVLLILSGKEKVKFVIGGKHLWARKYVPKNKKNGKSKAWM